MSNPNRSRAINAIAAAVERSLPGLTTVDRGLPKHPEAKTNPTPSAPRVRPLSARQLLAVRLMLEGRTTPQIAERLGISRQAVWKWSRNPVFVKELRAMHRWMLAQHAEARGRM